MMGQLSRPCARGWHQHWPTGPLLPGFAHARERPSHPLAVVVTRVAKHWRIRKKKPPPTSHLPRDDGLPPVSLPELCCNRGGEGGCICLLRCSVGRYRYMRMSLFAGPSSHHRPSPPLPAALAIMHVRAVLPFRNAQCRISRRKSWQLSELSKVREIFFRGRGAHPTYVIAEPVAWPLTPARDITAVAQACR